MISGGWGEGARLCGATEASKNERGCCCYSIALDKVSVTDSVGSKRRGEPERGRHGRQIVGGHTDGPKGRWECTHVCIQVHTCM